MQQPRERILIDRRRLPDKAREIYGFAAFTAVMILPALAKGLSTVTKPGAAGVSQGFWQTVVGHLPSPWAWVIYVGVAVAVAVLGRWYIREERLVLSETGVRYEAIMPAALRFLRPSWSLQWSQIRALRLRVPAFLGQGGTVGLRLHVETATGTRRLYPACWVDPEVGRPASLKERLGGAPPDQWERTTLESPLMQFILKHAPHVELDRGHVRKTIDFACDTASLLKLWPVPVALVAFLGYFAWDHWSARGEAYVGGSPVELHFAFGAAVGVLTGWWLGRREAPWRYRIVLGLFVGIAAQIAAIPGAIRINGFTDWDGPETHAYVLGEDYRLAPREPGTPELEFLRDEAYWHRFEPGSVHEFDLRRGMLGFYQVDVREYRRSVEAYRAARRDSTGAEGGTTQGAATE